MRGSEVASIVVDWLIVVFYGQILMANKSTVKDMISTLRASFAEEQKQAQEAFEAKLAEMLVNVKKNVIHSLQEAHNSFEGLEKTEQAAILDDADVKAVFASFGYVKRKATGSNGGTRGGRYDEAAILAFLADGEKEQAAIQAQFNTSKQSVVAWGKKLFDAGKIYTIEKRGRQKFWKAKI